MIKHSYQKAAERLSSLFRDQLQPPLQRAVFWTEFVLRHNGTQHLTLGSKNLNFLQRQLIDVYFILILSVIIPVTLMFFCLRKCCCTSKKNIKPQAEVKEKKKNQ